MVFSMGELKEVVYIEKPEGFVDPVHPCHVCKLEKVIYGLE